MSNSTAAPVHIPASSTTNDGYLFGKQGTVGIFLLLCLLMVFDFADRLIIAGLLPYIKAEWSLSDAQSGLLSSVLTLGMVLFAFPVSIAIDRWSRIKTASLMGVFWGLASASGAFAQNFGQLVTSRALVGAGEAAYAPASYAWISAAFPRRRLQLALGVFSASQPIGMALGIALGGFIAAHYGWRHALGLLAIPGILVAIALYRCRDYRNIQPDTPVSDQSRASSHWQVIRHNWSRIIRTPSLLLAYLSGGMATLQWVPIVFFLPTYLNRIHGIPLQQASLMTSGLLLVGVVAIPLGGWIMDTLTRRHPNAKIYFSTLAFALSATLYGIAFGATLDYQTQYLLIITASFAAAISGSGPLSMTQELAHPSGRALSGTTAVMTLHLLGSVPGPFLAGLLSDHYGLGQALFILPVVSGTLAVILLFLSLRYYQDDLSKIGDYKVEAG
ncbi:MFS transporter [Methylobacillus gramineus]|uniref:MFS transporter n=1 Tax=Methylobacillus gramineus TaxID=755169 RepID=UPI001CFF581A|nr:MFS transporter [Methylobacillus gramineus]MCB5184786.1 MFS transporter [Methylobacillus gramineus]